MNGFFSRTGVKITLGVLFFIALAVGIWFLSRKRKQNILKQVAKEQLAIQEAEEQQKAEQEAIKMAEITAKVAGKVAEMNAAKVAGKVAEMSEEAEAEPQPQPSLVQFVQQPQDTPKSPKAPKAKSVPFVSEPQKTKEPQTEKPKKLGDVPVGTSKEESEAYHIARKANTVESWTLFLAQTYPTSKLKKRATTAYEAAIAVASSKE